MRTEQQVIGALLRDDALLFGKRVKLTWPDGLPVGETEASLRELGENWSPVPQERPLWERVPVSDEFKRQTAEFMDRNDELLRRLADS